jgi:hypothetical protein
VEVININDRSSKKRKTEILEMLDAIRIEVENDIIEEIVVTVMTAEGDCEIHVAIKDVAGGVGMFEIGKHILIATEG